MPFASYAEHIADAQREHGARYIGPFEYAQRPISTPAPEPRPASVGLSGLEKIKVMMLRDKLLANTELLPYTLLSKADDWTEAHFEELIKKSPRAAVRFLMAYRESKFFLDICLEPDSQTNEAITTPEPKKKNKLNIKMHPASY